MNYVYMVHSGPVTRVLQTMLRSVDAHCRCTVLLTTDNEDGAFHDAVRQAFTQTITCYFSEPTVLRSQLMAIKVRQLQAMPFQDGDQVFVLDTDLLILADIFRAFDHPFDVGITSRHYDYWYRINGGVWCFRVNPASRDFIDFFVEQIHAPSWQPFVDFQQQWGHAGDLGWWCDQDFLCVVYDHQLPFECDILDLTYRYNYCPSVEENVPGTFESARTEILKGMQDADLKILHFKGRLKEVLERL